MILRQAIVDALSGAGSDYETAVTTFKGLLLNGVGSDGIKNGETIEFVLKGKAGNELGVAVKGVLAGWVKSSELRNKLVNVYVGENAVAPSVKTNLKSRYDACTK